MARSRLKGILANPTMTKLRLGKRWTSPTMAKSRLKKYMG
jgi:hypothetical protein